MGCVAEDVDYVAMAEQDDWYYPYRLEKQVAFLNENPEYGLVSGIAEFYAGDEVPITLFPGILVNKGSYPTNNTELFLLNYREQNKIVNTCMMFRRKIYFEKGLYFDTHFMNVSVDWAFMLRFSKYALIYGLHDVLVRMDRKSTRTSVTMNKTNQYLTTYELLRIFSFERRDIVTKKDYNYAVQTQKYLELGQYRFCKRWMLLWYYMFINKFDARVVCRFKKEIKKFI